MNSSAARKRNRSDNFDVNDIELLLTLVSEQTNLIDSPKLEAKKQGWDNIYSKFNANCTGIKRDMNALKLKIKNMKAQSKKSKLESPDPLSESHSDMNGSVNNDNETAGEEDDEYEIENGDEIDRKLTVNSNDSKIRKRCKRFTKDECDLLFKLYEKYCSGLDSSSTPSSVKKRTEAWDNLTETFNQQQTTGIIRENNELKIKIKNLKASRTKVEPSDHENTHILNESDTSTTSKRIIDDKKLINALPTRNLQTIPNQSKRYEDVAYSTDIYYEDDEFEDDETFNQSNLRNPSLVEDKELEKIRRENILLKNAVLRKKERLLELQISLAERNLRRQL